MAEQNTSASAPVVVVGFGVAAVNAIIALRSAGYAGKILAFAPEGPLPYSPVLTSYYAGGQKDYSACFPWSEEEIAALDVQVVVGERVECLDVQGHLVRTDKSAYAYEKCLVASGASPVTTGFPQVEGYEPLVLRTLADAQRLSEALQQRDARVLVCGASMVALKCIDACLARGVAATLAVRRKHVLTSVAAPQAAARIERCLQERGVTLRLGQTVDAVEMRAGELAEEGQGQTAAQPVLAVTFSNGQIEEFDHIVVAYGMASNRDFVQPGALEGEETLVVDEYLRTSDADVYAAGDVASFLERSTGEQRQIRLWKNAAQQGRVAGLAIAAELAGQTPQAAGVRAYEGPLSANTIQVGGALFISSGQVKEAPGRTAAVRESEGITVVEAYEGKGAARKLVGFNVASDEDIPGGRAYDVGAMLLLQLGSRS